MVEIVKRGIQQKMVAIQHPNYNTGGIYDLVILSSVIWFNLRK